MCSVPELHQLRTELRGVFGAEPELEPRRLAPGGVVFELHARIRLAVRRIHGHLLAEREPHPGRLAERAGVVVARVRAHRQRAQFDERVLDRTVAGHNVALAPTEWAGVGPADVEAQPGGCHALAERNTTSPENPISMESFESGGKARRSRNGKSLRSVLQ